MSNVYETMPKEILRKYCELGCHYAQEAADKRGIKYYKLKIFVQKERKENDGKS